jgi:flagellar biosynthetic protein FlhB
MAEEAFQDNLERTEEPTPRRREEARKQGQFARSRNLIPAATLVAIVIALRFGGVELMDRLERCIVGFFSAAGSMKQLTAEDLFNLSLQASLVLAPVLLPLFCAVLIAGLASGFLQSGFVLAAEPLQFDFARVSPVSGFRRLFSMDAAADLIKALLFIAALGWVGAGYIYGDIPALTSLTNMRVEDIVAYATHDGSVLSAWVVAAMGALAGLDYLFQRWRTDKRLRMSRQEIKQEMREQEGDPLLKAQLKSMRQKLARRRMMTDVAKADVVITNPTELAVALRYRAGEMSAPRILGKGAGYIAQKIREVARENGIALVENKPLARLLYGKVDVGREIPEALYRAVAEVLAYVYRLRRGAMVSNESETVRNNES